jgi:hypothetical protein
MHFLATSRRLQVCGYCREKWVQCFFLSLFTSTCFVRIYDLYLGTRIPTDLEGHSHEDKFLSSCTTHAFIIPLLTNLAVTSPL